MIRENDMNRVVSMFGRWYYWWRTGTGQLQLKSAPWLDASALPVKTPTDAPSYDDIVGALGRLEQNG